MAIRGHQRPSEAIRGHQWSSEVISGHQRSSVVISGHQRSSVVIRGHQWPSHLRAHERSSRGLPRHCRDRWRMPSEGHRRAVAVRGQQQLLHRERRLERRRGGRACGMASCWSGANRAESAHALNVLRGGDAPAGAISGNQWQSVAISGNQWKSVAISGNQWSSADVLHASSGAISGHKRSSGHQWPPAVISGHQRPSAAISGHQWPSAVISGPHLPRGLMKSEPLITRVTKVSPRERWHCPPSNEPMSSEALATAPAQLPALPALASWSAIGACSYVDAPTRQRAQSEAIGGNQRQ